MITITMAESFGIQGRGAFYDQVGTVRDVIQNHLVQVIGFLAMEAPAKGEAARHPPRDGTAPKEAAAAARME